jgi:hypothetical protein
MWSKKELIEKQARFWALMAQGSTVKAVDFRLGVCVYDDSGVEVGWPPRPQLVMAICGSPTGSRADE